MEKERKKIRSVLWLSLVMLIAFWLYLAIVPFGKISYSSDLTKASFFIGKLTPAERILDNSNKPLEIIGDPAYFTLQTLRPFSQVKLSLEFKNNTDFPLVEAGVLADQHVWRYQTKPLQNKIIDQLTNTWNVISEGDVLLLQRSKQFASVKDFLANLPDKNQIATYNYTLKNNYKLPGYEHTSQEQSFNLPLRGGYQFYTYIKNEPLKFKFLFNDLNLNRDSDPIELKLYKDGQIINKKELQDDGNTTDNGVESQTRELTMDQANLPEGVYKIEVVVNDDLVTKQIVTNQSKLSFINKIWLANGSVNQFKLYTDSSLINALTSNPAKLQTIGVGAKHLDILSTYQQYSATSSESLSEINLNKNDLILSGNGVFSFSSGALFNPEYKTVDTNLNLNNGETNFVIAHYLPPVKLAGGWLRATANLEIDSAFRELLQPQLGKTGKYNFLISIPGLKAEDFSGQGVDVRLVKVDLAGTSLVDKVFNKLQQIF